MSFHEGHMQITCFSNPPGSPTSTLLHSLKSVGGLFQILGPSPEDGPHVRPEKGPKDAWNGSHQCSMDMVYITKKLDQGSTQKRAYLLEKG